jgi:hypothetical protein
MMRRRKTRPPVWQEFLRQKSLAASSNLYQGVKERMTATTQTTQSMLSDASQKRLAFAVQFP